MTYLIIDVWLSKQVNQFLVVQLQHVGGHMHTELGPVNKQNNHGKSKYFPGEYVAATYLSACSPSLPPLPPTPTHTHTHAHAQTHIHSCARAHTHTHSHTVTHTQSHTHTLSLSLTHTHTHTHTHPTSYTKPVIKSYHVQDIRLFCSKLYSVTGVTKISHILHLLLFIPVIPVVSFCFRTSLLIFLPGNSDHLT